jgi:2'-5' RNA ligase
MTSGKRTALRTFFALWPDDGVRAALAERAAATARMCGGRAPRADLLHLTLVFIGATPPERVESLQDMMNATRIAAFTLQLDRCGWFRQSGVAWMGAQSPPEALIDLQHALARGASRLGFSLDVRPYVAHLTLARDARRAPPAGAIAPVEWRADSFALVVSDLLPDGPRYRVLHQTPLVAVEPAGAPAH